METKHLEALYPYNARFNEIARLLDYIKTGASCQIVGIPGVGRSNLFGLLAYNRNVRLKHLGEKQKQFHFVIANFAEIGKRNLSDVLKFLFLRITYSLKERNMQEEQKRSNDIFKEIINSQEELVLSEGFKEVIDYLCLERKINVVFLFDKFEHYIPSITNQLFTYLHTLKGRAKEKFSVVFSLNRPLETYIDIPTVGDFYTNLAGHTIILSLTDTPSLLFKIAQVEKSANKKLSQEEKETIINLTAGHGKMARVSTEEVLGNQDTKDLKEFLLNNRAVRSVSYEIWEALTPHERDILKKISLHKPVSLEDAKFLTDSGIVSKNNITIPLFAEFVQFRANQPAEEKITYNPDTRQITKGEEMLSDKLTGTEFKLLRYMIENQNRIIERDEIINSVWPTISIAGVTDQALDQLIFRLRKKIEENPNQPIHLQTIKGRGIRFTP